MSFIDSLEKVVATVSDALDGGTIGAVVEIGKDVLKLLDNAQEVIATEDVDKLNALRDQLEPLVLAHADSTEKALRGS